MGPIQRRGRPSSGRKGGGGGQKKKGGGGGGGRRHHDRKAKKGGDAYEYEPSSFARRKRAEGEEVEEEGGVAEEDDEEIDEDMVFTKEDEKKYGEVLKEIARNARRNQKTRGKGQVEEEDEEDEDGDEEEEDEEEGYLAEGLLVEGDEEEEEGGGEGEEEESVEGDDEEGEDEEGEEEEDDDEGEDHEGLLNLIDQLASSSQKGKGEGEEGGVSSIGQHLQNLPESEFAPTGSTKLSLNTLLQSLSDTKGFSAIKKKLKEALSSSEGAVKAPAPAVIQSKAARQVVYEQKKKDAAEWLPLVSAARQAESLNFSYEPRLNITESAMVAKFNAQTDMEKAIQAALQHAGTGTEEEIQAKEKAALEARGCTPEQVKARMSELAKMRALMFYDQMKRHRANKIKSKAYHRIRKKQRLRKAEKDRELLREVDPEAAREADEKEAVKRMEERMSLRHKNTSKWAKHVLQHGGNRQVETRQMVHEQLRLGEELRKKAMGNEGEDESDDDDDDDDEDDDEDTRRRKAKGKAAEEVRDLLAEIEADQGDQGQPAKGLFGMKFMQRAVEKQRKRAKEEVEAVLRELEEEEEMRHYGSSDEEEEKKKQDHEKEETRKKAAGGGGGEEDRAAAQKVVSELMEGGGLQMPSVALGGQAKARVAGAVTVAALPPPPPPSWSSTPSSSTTKKGKAKATTPPSVNATSAVTSTSAVGMAGEASTSTSEPVNPWLARPEASSAGGKKTGLSRSKARRQGTGAKGVGVDVGEAVATVLEGLDHEDDNDDGDEDDNEGKGDILVTGKDQERLVRRAFAAPDLEADFEKEKAEAIEEEVLGSSQAKKARAGSKVAEVDGWGSWAGLGAPPPPPPPPAGGKRGRKRKGAGNDAPPLKKVVRFDEEEDKKRVEEDQGNKIAGREETGMVTKLKRKDDAMPTVHISEKRSKAHAKYKLTEVPYPFTSREQYERALRLPLGKEWNTTLTVQDHIRPKVKVRPGTVVAPLKKTKQHRAVFPSRD